MTNSPGYIYYLLDRRPASQFVHVSMAITPYSQQLLIDSLRRSRPPVVVFDSAGIGLPVWDGIVNNVRHYDVSQYLLSNYQPIVRTHGVLLMLRNDLMASRPALPQLIVPPLSTDLYFSGPACVWGSIPSFLSSPVSGASVEISVTPREPLVATTITGWAVAAGAPAPRLVLASGRKVLAAVSPSIQRPDLVGRVGKYALYSGFSAAGDPAARRRRHHRVWSDGRRNAPPPRGPAGPVAARCAQIPGRQGVPDRRAGPRPRGQRNQPDGDDRRRADSRRCDHRRLRPADAARRRPDRTF